MKKLLITLCACTAMVIPTIASADRWMDPAPTYEQMMREPGKLAGTKACWRGLVFQVRETKEFTEFFVATNANFDDVSDVRPVYAQLSGKMPEPRIIDADTVEICGDFVRLYTYEGVKRNEITIPAIALDSVRRTR